MIFEGILSFVLGAIELILGILPDADINVTNFISNGITSFRTALAAGDWIFPVNSLLQVLRFIFAVELAILLFKLGRWVLRIVTVGHVQA